MSDAPEGPVGYVVEPCRIFISDTHVSGGIGLDPDPGKFPYEWCTRMDMARLVAFLKWVASRGEVQELVLLGDVFDNWTFPVDMKPPTLEWIVSSEHARPVVKAINAVAEVMPVVYMPGNHDITMTPQILSVWMPKVVFGGPGTEDSFFASSRLRGEHGHAHALFCSGDPAHDEGLPLGYFISRLAATSDRDTGGHSITRQQIVRDILDTVEKDDLGRGVLDAICSRAGLCDDTVIAMPDDIWNGATLTVRDVGHLYAGLFTQWEKRHGVVAAVLAITAELNELEACAMPMFARGGTNAVVMGHTHRAMAHEHVIPFLGTAAYVNAGCWSNNTPTATWIEQVKDEEDGRKRTSLKVMGCLGVDEEGLLRGISQVFPTVVAK